jgi:FkbM family methyltransferase
VHFVSLTHSGVGFRIATPSLTDQIAARIDGSGTFYESDVLGRLRRYVSAADIVIDVGANLGNHTVFFAAVMKARAVVSFEANPKTFEALSETIRVNGLSNVGARNQAVSNHAGRVRIHTEHAPDSLNLAYVTPSANGAIVAVRLDDVSCDGKVTLIKVDVEGHEFEVLAGAAQLLQRDRPVLCIEMHHRRDMARVGGWLARRGYVIVERSGSAPTYILLPCGRFKATLALAAWWLMADRPLSLPHWYLGRLVRFFMTSCPF